MSHRKIAFTTEKNINYKNLLSRRKPVNKERTVDAIALATCSIAVDVDAKAIVNLTASGFTSEMISNYRPHVDVLTITTDKEESFKLALNINKILSTTSTKNTRRSITMYEDLLCCSFSTAHS